MSAHVLRAGVVLSVLLALAPATAQEPPEQPPKDWHGGALGETLATLPDSNGDGIQEVLVGAPHAEPDGVRQRGQLLILSGKDGSQLKALNGSCPYDFFSASVSCVPDCDGDGQPDILIAGFGMDTPGHEAQGVIHAYSITETAPVHTLTGTANLEQLGFPVLGIPDIDGDRRGDFAAGVPWAHLHPPPGLRPPKGSPNEIRETGGEVRIFSGKDAHLLLTIRPATPRDWTTLRLATIPDLSGDGIPDLAVGAPYAREVSLYSTSDGALIRTIPPVDEDLWFGDALAMGPDSNGDGLPDLLIGAPRPPASRSPKSGSVYLYSLKDAKLLLRVPDPAELKDLGSMFGCSLTTPGDLNSDGVADFLVGAGTASPSQATLAGAVHGFSGKDGTLLFSLAGQERDRFGETLASVGDINADKIPDFVVGAPWAVSGKYRSAGQVIAISGKDRSTLWTVTGRKW